MQVLIITKIKYVFGDIEATQQTPSKPVHNNHY